MKINPFIGLGDIHFGSYRKNTREKIAGTFTTFEKGVGSGVFVDSYDTLGMHLYYDDNDRLEFIETFDPCDAEYDGMKLIEMSPELVEHYFRDKGFTINNEDGAGFVIPELGITIYVPLDDIEAVGVFRRGYFDE